ncbi:hypothetical protein GGTG_12372 [Gaeumannomyces tritici R3-111a-1]|uniref:NAD(P)-binding domain-containing protein n=1 Tax=Gaeumannomyces tritici (strain R3-111a-1) TaxID=644352 RepID=J3PFU7_GAET3|nr:hypothetical protein GGTG_12372 [Gaeumannomyces tritici R3-111a-1]EJT70199.1 hypothetical protein GGTG_12372 [Gaeumannomyces tritici R3-111a-1]
MKVAIAGVGNFGRYLLEEIPKEGHELVVLTRSRKPDLEALGVEQRVTDYTPAGLAAGLADVDVVVATIPPTAGRAFVATHLALLDACRRPGARCRRLVVSHWGSNHEDVPDQPLGAGAHMQEVVDALAAQREVEWTAVSCGWLADYVLPRTSRHLADIGEAWPQDHAARTFTLYGLGGAAVDVTAARDAARATARLVTAAAEGVAWEKWVYVSGERTTWRGLWGFVKGREPDYMLKKRSLAQSVEQYKAAAAEDDPSGIVAAFELIGHSEALEMPADKVAAHREKYFAGIKFRTLAELADEAKAKPGTIV